MKLTTKVRYGLRAVIEIAQKAKDEPLNISDLANSQGISIKYLEAILVKLRNAEIIKSVRGKKGGYLLAKKPENITVYDIFNAMDEPIELAPCLCADTLCTRDEFCGTKELWQDLTQSIENKLKYVKVSTLL